MTSSPVSPWLVDEAALRGQPVRRLLAALLWRASHALSHWATQVAAPSRSRSANRAAALEHTLPQLEFHAEAGAPEGALYVDGVLFGHLPGVHRL